MMANGVYAMSAITALTAQNTTGVTSILNADSKFLGEELGRSFLLTFIQMLLKMAWFQKVI